MKKIAIAAVSVLIIGLTAGVSIIINKSADSINEDIENDSIFYFEKNTSLPDGIEVFSDDNSAASTPPLWRVTSADGNTLYMVGTMHALKPECYPISKAVGDAFKECSAVAVEIKNCDVTDLITDAEDHIYSPYLEKGDMLKAHLTDEQYSALSAYMSANGKDVSEFEGCAPWYVYQNFTEASESALLGDYGFDMVLQIMANIEEKEILSVETLEAKHAYWPEMDERIVGMLIKRGCTDEDYSEELVDLWSKGDLNAIMELYLSDEGLDAEEKELWQQYLSYSFDSRNEIMAAKAEEYLNSGRIILMGVGTAHYFGDHGLPSLLEAKGYTVERIE